MLCSVTHKVGGDYTGYERGGGELWKPFGRLCYHTYSIQKKKKRI